MAKSVGNVAQYCWHVVIDDFEYQVRFLLQPLLAGNDPRALLDAQPVGLEEGMLDGKPVQVDVSQRVSEAFPDEDLVLPRCDVADDALEPSPDDGRRLFASPPGLELHVQGALGFTMAKQSLFVAQDLFEHEQIKLPHRRQILGVGFDFSD